jgi:hypothetical protein
MLKPPFLCFSPVSGSPSNVHGQSSIFNLSAAAQPSTAELFLESQIQKNKSKSNVFPLHMCSLFIAPPHMRVLGVRQPELNRYCTELFRNN